MIPLRSLRQLVVLAAVLSSAAIAQDSIEITGRAVDRTGRPVAGAKVGVFSHGQLVNTPELLAAPGAVTDDAGRYRVAATRSRYGVSVVVAKNGFQACEVRVATASAQGPIEVAEALILPGSSLAGRVRDDAGKPLVGVHIRVESAVDDHVSAMVRLVSGAVTDNQGIFRVPCVPRTGLRVTALRLGYLDQSFLAAQHTPLNLTMERVGVVRGRVVDAAGKPVSDVHVHGVTVESRNWFHERVVSRDDGSFVVTVPKRGRFRVAGSEQAEPWTSYSSDLLHGPQHGVLLTPRGRPGAIVTLEIRAVAEGTGKAIHEFRASIVDHVSMDNLQVGLLWHYARRESHVDKAFLDVASSRLGGSEIVIVDADGYGWAAVPMPQSADEPLAVALGPEAAVTGQVRDEATGKPMPGVAVRALPVGNSSGGGGDPTTAGVVTDAEGRYRVRGLRPGDYVLQAYHPKRPASAVARTEAKLEVEARCDLTVPRERWLELELQGDPPPGPPGRIAIHGSISSPMGFFGHVVGSTPGSVRADQGRIKLGPVDSSEFVLALWLPSRSRLGAGTSLDLPTVDPAKGPVTLQLPNLKLGYVRGRVVLPRSVPPERVAVLARREPARATPFGHVFGRPRTATLDADGGFEMDVPRGKYTLQLIDLRTGIVFHTEAEDLEVEQAEHRLDLVPAIHWLAVQMKPESPGDPVVLLTTTVKLDRPRSGEHSAFLRSWSSSGDTEKGAVPFEVGAVDQRWLVPAGSIELEALQTFEILRPWATGYSGQVVASAGLEIENATHSVTLTIPAPPSDEELLRRE